MLKMQPFQTHPEHIIIFFKGIYILYYIILYYIYIYIQVLGIIIYIVAVESPNFNPLGLKKTNAKSQKSLKYLVLGN
jgi:hypothetical protein